MIKVERCALEGVLLLRPRVFHDERGHFLESWNRRLFDEAVGRSIEFVQDNRSRSKANVLRGLHYQEAPAAQAKLVSVTAGTIFDVVVDLRESAMSYGQWVGFELDSEAPAMLWIPEGFAHGFLVLSKYADVTYKATNFYPPSHERCIRWNDATLDIHWPLHGNEPVVSAKDQQGSVLPSETKRINSSQPCIRPSEPGREEVVT